MSVALSNSLEREFGLPVSVAELIKGPTINQLVDGVFSELIGTIPAKREQPPALQFLGKPIVIGEPPAANSMAKTMEVPSQHGTGRNGAAFAATRLHARPQASVIMRHSFGLDSHRSCRSEACCRGAIMIPPGFEIFCSGASWRSLASRTRSIRISR